MLDRTSNEARAAAVMERWKTGPIPHRINGEDVLSDATFEVISPVNLQPIATCAKGGAKEVDMAARAAAEAFPEWAAMDGARRKKLLHRVADLITRRADEIALTECLDTGQAWRFMSKAAIRGAENFRFFADRAPTARDGQSLYGPGQINVTSRHPIGPVGVITPWNTPFMLSTWKIAPALAAGCTVVHKPAELSPLTARILAEIAEEAGIPKGVWNLVNGFGEDAGAALTSHPKIKAVAFVGDSKTGSMIMKQGADTLKRVHFELGGKNPVVVFADADLQAAADAAVFMIYSLNGERCTSSSRLLVEASVHDRFCEMVAEKANNIPVGHPLDPKTVIGPLIHPNHFNKVTGYFDVAREEGATIAAGGEPADQPCTVKPTLFTGARSSMRIAQEEIFGPVLTAMPFETEEEALTLANDVAYGLAGYVWTRDLTRAMRFTDRLDAGMIWVNSENLRHLPAPFGGVKASGIGRDGGDWSFDFYMETKNVAFMTADRAVPKLGG